MLTEITVIDRIMIEMVGPIHIIYNTTVTRDNQVLVSTQSRRTLNPGDDISNEDTRITTIAGAVWTPDVIQRFNESMASRMSGPPSILPTLFTSEGPNNG